MVSQMPAQGPLEVPKKPYYPAGMGSIVRIGVHFLSFRPQGQQVSVISRLLAIPWCIIRVSYLLAKSLILGG